MKSSILTKASLASQDLDPDHRMRLAYLIDCHPKAEAVVPKNIPLGSVIALGHEMGDMVIEFDAFDDVPAGGVRVRADQNNRPVLIQRRMNEQALVADLSYLRSRSREEIAQRLDDTLTTLINESSLDGPLYLGGLKSKLFEHITQAKPLEVPSSFMGYSPMELTVSNLATAICSWLKKSPDGRKASLSSDPNSAATMLYMHYRDEFRLHEKQSIQQALRTPRSTHLAEFAERLWGDEYTSHLLNDPRQKRPKGMLRP